MANVLFRRGTQEYINNNVPISDGQVVFNETDQAIYVDTPVNNVITRLRYGGGNLSRSDIDSALSDTSENPVQNKVITESVLQKTDVVNDYNTAVAVTATDIPVGCGVIKTANTKIGDLQTAVAQHTADIASLNTDLAKLSYIRTVVFNNVSVQPGEAKKVGNITDSDILTKYFFPFLPNIIGGYFADQVVNISSSPNSQPTVWIKNTADHAFNGTVAVSYMVRDKT
jgi:hypothetical protein